MFELSPQEWTAVALSLRVAAVSTVVALPFGIVIAMLLARGSFWGKSLLDAVVHLPLVLPPVVTGYLLLISLGRKAPLGALLADFGIVFSFRWTGAALACGHRIACRNVPLMAWPLNVTASTFPCLACSRNAEYGNSTELLAAGPNRMSAFQASSTRKITIQIRPGSRAGGGGGAEGPLGCGGGVPGGVGNVTTKTIDAVGYGRT